MIRVQAVRFADSGVDVVLRVRTDAPLPSHPAVLLRPRSLFGEWGAAIVPAGSRAGMGEDSIPRPDGVLPGQTATDFAQLSDYTAEIASNLQTITQRVEVAFNKQTAANLARSIDNFEKASADLDSTLARLEQATQGGQLQDIFANVQKASGSMTHVASRMDTTMGHVNHVATRADSVLGAFNALLAGVNAGHGSLGQLANDPDLYENLASTLVELRSLLDELKRNPGKYFKFSIF